MINSRKIEDLDADTQVKCRTFIAKCLEAGIDVLVYSTLRDAESQNEIYAEGRTKPGSKKTWVVGGKSFHQWRCAFDFVPRIGGIAQWNDIVLYERCGAIGEACGLEWGGRWKKNIDRPHMQNTRGHVVEDFISGKARF